MSGLAMLGLLLVASLAGAHPMGNFSICHYARLQPEADELRLHYLLDFAEVPTVTERARLDHDVDGRITDDERQQYLAELEPKLRAGLTVTANGQPLALRLTASDARLTDGAAGLAVLKVTFDWHAVWPAVGTAEAVAYRDDNYPDRIGWKEVIAVAGPGMALADASVPATDRSRELTEYPTTGESLRVLEATFTASRLDGAPTTATSSPVAAPNASKRRANRFTESISARRLTPGIMLLGVLLAFFFGCGHALAPGHGKAMVAAYLVGSRGTARHALILGLTLTVTHTFGVFVLGFVALWLQHYLVPEQLVRWMSLVSALAVLGVGLWLLRRRPAAHQHELEEHAHEHGGGHEHSHGGGQPHSHGGGQPHSHGGGHAHSHEVPERVSLGSLLALGISGGIVPCPDALVVLLSAVYLGRTLYGLLLITSFSAGLAAVLVALGLLVVSGRRWLDRVPAAERWLAWLPRLSALVVTAIGIAMLVAALRGTV